MKKYTLILVSTFVLFACGSSSGNLDGKYSVNDVNILADDIQVGESVRAEIFFETKFETDGTPDGLSVIVRVPAELEYLPGSSFIYDNTTGVSDPYSPSDIRLCDTGETFLIYDFQEFNLSGRELGNPGNFGFKFEVSGLSSVPLTFIGATAGRGDEFICGTDFPAEEREGVQVL